MSTGASFSVLKLLFTLAVIWLSFILFTSEQHWIFIDNANLAIHEGGHLVFMAFGRFMHVLGGSLTQLLMPILFTGYFLYTRQYFSSAFCLWWIGDNCVNVARYISDARLQALPLLGGDGAIHDWHYLLDQLHLLTWDTTIGGILFALGIVICSIGILGMATLAIFHRDPEMNSG